MRTILVSLLACLLLLVAARFEWEEKERDIAVPLILDSYLRCKESAIEELGSLTAEQRAHYYETDWQSEEPLLPKGFSVRQGQGEASLTSLFHVRFFPRAKDELWIWFSADDLKRVFPQLSFLAVRESLSEHLSQPSNTTPPTLSHDKTLVCLLLSL